MAYTKSAAACWIVCALAVNICLFFGLHALTGLGLPILTVLPVAAAAFFLGLRPGLFASVLAIPFNLGMFVLTGAGWLDTLFNVQFITGALGIVLVGGLLGRMRDLGRDLQQQHDHLHSLVQDQTRSLRESHERLKAREQELSAANMQLRAHEEQLVAVNGQLRAQELELREANAYLENILATKADGLIVMDRGTIIKVNQALLSMLGCSEKDLINRSIFDVAAMDTGDVGRLRAMTVELYRHGFLKNRQLMWHKKDGTACPVEINLTLLKNEYGQARGSVCEVRDISEKRRIDDERMRLFAAMEQSSESIMIFDRSGTIQYCNAALEHLAGYRRNELVGKSYEIAADSTESSRFYRGLLEYVGTGAVWTGRISPTAADGTRRDCEITISPVRDSEGVISSFVSIGRDVTREMRMEKQLRQAQKMEAIGTLAGGIAHDFNNILTAIIGYAELGLREVPGGGSVASRLAQILKSANRARDLVKQILTFSSFSEPEARPVCLKSVVKEALGMMRSTMPATIDIRTHIITDAIVIADPTQVHQIIMNLCANADYAMSTSGGTLTVVLREEKVDAGLARAHAVSPGLYTCLEVTDTGTGIPTDSLDHIFEPFYTTKAKGEGTGMGLAVVHGIVRSCGGFITVRSAFGHGTAFEVYLPSVDAPEPEMETYPDMLPGGTEHILFIDDELTIVEVAVELLSALGYRVTATHITQQALELFERSPYEFDLVITDRTMPKMTGLELAARLRALRPEIPIILCSGYRLDPAEESIKKSGIQAALLKPLDFKNVADTIRNVLDESIRLMASSA